MERDNLYQKERQCSQELSEQVEVLKFEVEMLTKKQKATIIEPTDPDALTGQVKKLEQENNLIRRKNVELTTKNKNQRQEIS